MKGIIIFYLNYFPEKGQDVDKMIDIFKSQNADLLLKLREDALYQVAIVPTTQEASRVEKVDFDAPFPRFVASKIDLMSTEHLMNKKKAALEEGKDD